MTHPACRWVDTPTVEVGYNDRNSLLRFLPGIVRFRLADAADLERALNHSAMLSRDPAEAGTRPPLR
jgi:hypothetical protein